MILSLIDLHWLRPAGFGLWVLALWLIWLLRRKTAPVERATGTLELWKSIAAGRTSQAKTRARRLPPRAWWLVLSFVAGGLAVAAPRPNTPRAQERWCFEIDRSLLMFLPWNSGAERSRYEVAVASATSWLDRQGVSPSARVWRSPGLADVRSALPAPEWAEAPRFPVAELSTLATSPGGSSWNRVTDRIPDGLPATIGYFAAGGDEVHGPIGVHEGRYLVWDGERVSLGDPAPARRLFMGEGAPLPIAELAAIWAEERGVLLASRADEADVRIEVAIPRSTGTHRAFADGWQVDVRAGAPDDAGLGDRSDEFEDVGATSTTWLRSEDGSTDLVRVGPGRVRPAFDEVLELRGDDAALAVAWSELFDSVLPPALGTLPFAERQSAGPEASRAPRSSPATGGDGPAPTRPEAWLALLATVFALLACVPLRRRVLASEFQSIAS